MHADATDDELLDVLDRAAAAVRRALDGLDDWGPSGQRAGQYRSDLTADAACLAVLHDAGLAVMSEESGRTGPESGPVVVVDPVDGSTNASRGIPWFATSLCVIDADGARLGLVVNQASGRRFHAVRGGGAFADGVVIAPRPVDAVGDAIVALSGYPPEPYGWRQFRALGAAALDLCAVAEGVVDGYVDCSFDAHGSWDYAAGALICIEAGATVSDALGRELFTVDHAARRTPVAGATATLHRGLVEARNRGAG